VRLFTRPGLTGHTRGTSWQLGWTKVALATPTPNSPPKGHVYLALTVEIPLNFIRVAVVAIVLVCCSFSAQFGPQSILLLMHAYTVFMQFVLNFPRETGEKVRLPPSENVALHLTRTLLWADASHFNITRHNFFIPGFFYLH